MSFIPVVIVTSSISLLRGIDDHALRHAFQETDDECLYSASTGTEIIGDE